MDGAVAARGRPDDACRRRRAPARRVRCERPQRRLVLGAAAREPRRPSTGGTVATRPIAWQRAMIDTVDVVGQFCADSATPGPRPAVPQGRHGDRRPRRAAAATARARRRRGPALRVRRRRRPPARCRPRRRDHLRAVDVRGATFTPHCAAVHPLRLVRAIAAAATRAGARIVEGVDVVELEPHRLTTTAGTIRADVVVLATEAYTSQLPGRRRDVLPIYSMMIGSEPLSDAQWARSGSPIGRRSPCASHVIVYGQRTADGRIAFGGRGAPYHFGSRVDDRFDTDERVRSALLRRRRGDVAAAAAGVDFPYHWGGPLAAPRDWHPHVAYDPRHGLASAGGYVGDGVAAANLAGRTLADLICGRDTEITRLPWVGHRSRSMGAGAAALAGGPHGRRRPRPAPIGPRRRPARSPPPVPPPGPSSPPSSPVADIADFHRENGADLHRSPVEIGRSGAVSGGGWGRRSWRGGGSCGSTRRTARRRARAGGRTASSTGRARGCRGRTGRRPSG